ncbi:MAG: OmpH family outer membrane protein [Chitinophagaceae bacterium]|nr:OmpH family outer membrane protein [Chitinophagaceae bacterium]
MKNLSVILSALALVGVIILFGMELGPDDDNVKADKTQKEATGTEGRIAFVNIDSLESKYEYLKMKQEELEAKNESMASELERSQQKFQQDYLNMQRKAQAGTLTQAEAEAAEKRLRQMSQSLESRKEALTEQLMKEQDDFNKDLKKRLDNFLEDYNKDKGYDYILSYSSVINSILLANDALDITDDVINGMNAEYKSSAGASNTEKKKNK